MKFNSLHLENFRGYEVLDIETFNPSFNLIIGENGSGKTAILEALTVAMGSFFLGIKNVNSRHILSRDVHVKTFQYSQEYIWPVIVAASGTIANEDISWSRELNGPQKGKQSRTTFINAANIKNISVSLDTQVRKGQNVDLPILAYYSTGRLFDEASDNKNEEDNKQVIASRFRAYTRCLESKSTYKQFKNWFRSKELSNIQKRDDDLGLKLVKEVLVHNIPGCEQVFYEFDKDKNVGINVQLSDGRTLPFEYLSDGTRNFFAIMADIAYKCVTLNRHLEERVLLETKGIILIDELDLHLHPEWQRKIVEALTSSFPSIQFIASTHSPFLIQETATDQLIILKNGSTEKGRGNNLSIEDIAEELQLVDNPQWSKKRQLMFEVAKEYYKAVEAGTDTQEMKEAFDKAMKPFAVDTAFYAIIEQRKVVAEYKKARNETN